MIFLFLADDFSPTPLTLSFMASVENTAINATFNITNDLVHEAEVEGFFLVLTVISAQSTGQAMLDELAGVLLIRIINDDSKRTNQFLP